MDHVTICRKFSSASFAFCSFFDTITISSHFIYLLYVKMIFRFLFMFLFSARRGVVFRLAVENVL